MRNVYFYGIYRKNEPNNIIYIGQHNYYNLNDSYMGSGKNILELYKNEGKENFDKVILENIEYDENSDKDRKLVGEKEKFYILKYKSIGQAELNISNGSGPSLVIKLPENITFQEYLKQQSRQWYEKNRENVLKRQKEYSIKNKEKIRKYKKEYKEKNREKILEKEKIYNETHKEQVKVYNEKNKEKIAARKKEYRIKNKEHLDEKNKEWRIKNKEKIAARKKEYRIKNKEYISLYGRAYRIIKKDNKKFEIYKKLPKKDKKDFIKKYILENNL